MSDNKFFYANDERKNDNSKNIKVTAFKEQLSLNIILEITLLKHENIRLLTD